MAPWAIFSVIFELFYNRLAFLVDPLLKCIFRGKWLLWQLEIEKRLRGKNRILEIGCGTGTLVMELAGRNIEIIGIDLSSQMLKIARRKAKKQKGRPALVRGKAQDLPFMDGSFDVVFSMFPAQFILTPETFMEIRRVLHPRGMFACLPWVRMRPNSLASLLQKLIYGKNEPTISQLIDLARRENLATELQKVADKEGNESFFLFCCLPSK